MVMDAVNSNFTTDKLDHNKEVDDKNERPSLLELQEMTASAKITQAKLLASKLNYPLTGKVTAQNVDAILIELKNEADSISIKEKRERGIHAEDTRLGDATETMTEAALTDNDSLFSTVLGLENEEDLDDEEKLRLMYQADGKGITYYDSMIDQGEDQVIKRKVELFDEFENAHIEHLLDSDGRLQAYTELEDMDLDQSKLDALGEVNINIDLANDSSKNQIGKA